MASQWPQMTGHKGIVLDANILLRAVFGHQVLHLLEAYEDKARFLRARRLLSRRTKIHSEDFETARVRR